MARARFGSVLVALVGSGLVLGACGPRGGGNSDVVSVWTFPQGDDEVPIKAYIERFEAQNPEIDLELLVVPEEGYVTKINASLQAHEPPDVAIIEDQSWMKAGRVADLAPHLERWGVDVADFNPGGIARLTVDDRSIDQGVFGVGDFVGGNVLVYNKELFDAAGVDYPPVDRSLTIQEYAELCRALAQPGGNPQDTRYGCSMPAFGFSFLGAEIWGEDGRQALGNVNSPEMVEAFNVGSAVVRDGLAPSGSVLDTIQESDLFAEGRIAITQTDFTEVEKYQDNDVEFGLAPFWVVDGSQSAVDTWTAAWGTFTESRHPEEALQFLEFIATEAQRIRTEVTPDPPLSMSVAEEIGYGDDDPVKQQYLEVLRLAEPQVFVPPGMETYDHTEIMRLMTVEGQTDARPILDGMAEAVQEELDQAWVRWESIGDQ